MFIQHDDFKLKRSQISIAFQCCLLIIILIVLFNILPSILWVLSLIFLLVSAYLHHSAREKIIALEKLDEHEWSVQLEEQNQIYNVKITHFIDHYFYVSLSTDHKKLNSIIIWKDQLDLKSWKRLLVHAKMH